jgi:hypothetical protein
VVTNGTYAGGSRLDPYGVLNCVVVDKPLTVQSVNGPGVTVINSVGEQGCAYLTNNAVIVGFTLTNGLAYQSYGGGVYCESTNSVLTNCVLTGNVAQYDGAGAYGGTLNNCTLTGNSALEGGGAENCILNNCTLTGNSANAYYSGIAGFVGGSGGGAWLCTLNNCTLTGNSARAGGGVCGGTLNNCTLTGNSANACESKDGNYFPGDGGGAYSCSLNNCTLTGNSTTDDGAGAFDSTLNNCTLTGNSAYEFDGYGGYGGGAYSCTLNNCIVYFNSAPNGGNYDPSSTLNYCCTTPLPTNGVGNISADPQLASASHLSALSPCIGAGSATYASGTDIDGDAWNNPPSIGCDEYHAGAVTGPLTVNVTATLTNVVINYPVGLTAFIEGRTDLSVWDFGDGDVAVDEPYTSHTWTLPGDYLVTLWAFNDTYPEGVSATVIVHVELGLHYVEATSGNPVAPYTSWATAATNIQDAVDVALPGATIFVTNGTYAHVTVNTPLTLESINGPDVTVIDGGGQVGCVYLTTTNTVMVGFTLTNGFNLASYMGGGVYCESPSAVLTNCVLAGNSAGGGGGAYGGTLNNCTLTGNSATFGGGGALSCTLNNCTLAGNSATGYYGGDGGGAYYCTLNNCIVYFNSDPNGGNYDPSSTLNYCCTTPMPTNGVGNITNAPVFVDYAGGNLRLQTNSPCINSGNNTYAPGPTDLDGNPRIVGGTVDIGAYEYQTPTSIISYAWLQQYGLPTDGSADHADLDGTGMSVYQDWVAGLNPTNALSVLKMTSATKTNNPAGLVVTWESVNTRTYYLQRSTNLAAQPAFSTIQSNIVGQAGTTSYTDTNAVGSGPFFYRVGVGN